MLERIVRGEVPAKHHIAFRDGSGALRHEECITRDGFEGPYTIAYHVHRPHTHRPAESPHGWPAPEALPPGPLRKRHFRICETRCGCIEGRELGARTRGRSRITRQQFEHQAACYEITSVGPGRYAAGGLKCRVDTSNLERAVDQSQGGGSRKRLDRHRTQSVGSRRRLAQSQECPSLQTGTAPLTVVRARDAPQDSRHGRGLVGFESQLRESLETAF